MKIEWHGRMAGQYVAHAGPFTFIVENVGGVHWLWRVTTKREPLIPTPPLAWGTVSTREEGMLACEDFVS